MLSLPSFILLAAAAAQAAVLTIQNPQYSIKSSDDTVLVSDQLSILKKPSEPLKLSQKDTLKLTFQIVDKDTGVGVQPHQTFLRFYDEVSGEEGIQPVRVTTGGKAKFELNMARPPPSFPPTADMPLNVTLILGSFEHDPVKFSLFDLSVPRSQPPPQHPDEPSFHLQPEIQHTFRPDPKSPPKLVSAAFTVLVLSPWLVLLSLWAHIVPRIKISLSPSVLPFIVLLCAFEGLLLWYWVDLKLGQVLLYGGVLGILAIFAGNHALATIGKQRLGRK